MSTSHEHLVLIGMMASGKTTVGRILGWRTGRPYVDNDVGVQALADVAPPDLISAAGERSLHEAEASAFLRALADEHPAVIGAAAWVVLDPACRAALERSRAVVYLRARPTTLHGRIGVGHGRRGDATDLAWLRARHEERDSLYRALATVTIDTDDQDPEAVAAAAIEALAMTPGQAATAG